MIHSTMIKKVLKCGLFLAIFFLLTLAVTVKCSSDDEGEVFPNLIQTLNGPLKGVVGKSRNESKSFVAFTGLRYANPPTRFEPPQPLVEKWTEPKLANLPGNFCPQFGEEGDVHTDEDCLFLHVYVPKTQLEKGKGKLPVMVWIHGGGYLFGDGFNYKPQFFMENEDVILVTINYRLGSFGFLSMEDDTLIGNNGLRDQVMALKWIQDNIAAFKGDPDNVVIFGNSAGSASVHYLLMSPLAKGLFHKGIMQSGAFSFWSYSPNPTETTLRFATHLGCKLPSREEDMSREIRKCLEDKPVEDILRAQAEFYPRWPMGNVISRFLPTAKESKSQNPFFKSSPESFFTLGKGPTHYASKVPVIAGTTRHEGSTLFTAMVFSDTNSLDDLNKKWNQIAPKTFCFDSHFPPETHAKISHKLKQFYFGKSQQITTEHSTDTLSVVYSDALFTLPVMAAATEMAMEGMPVWPYVFSYAGWSIRNAFDLYELPGMVGHADELQYQFPHPTLGHPLEVGSIQEKFSRLFVKFWIHFAKNGEPAQEFVIDGEELNWNPIKKTSKPNQDIEVLNIITKPKAIKFDYYDRLQFWRDLTKNSARVPKPAAAAPASSKIEL